MIEQVIVEILFEYLFEVGSSQVGSHHAVSSELGILVTNLDELFGVQAEDLNFV